MNYQKMIGKLTHSISIRFGFRVDKHVALSRQGIIGYSKAALPYTGFLNQVTFKS